MLTLKLALAAALAALALAAPTAGAVTPPDPITGTWYLQHGKISIVKKSNGRFKATVVDSIKFTHCTYGPSTVLWDNIRRVVPGFYRGTHKGNVGTNPCATTQVLEAWWMPTLSATKKKRLYFCAWPQGQRFGKNKRCYAMARKPWGKSGT